MNCAEGSLLDLLLLFYSAIQSTLCLVLYRAVRSFQLYSSWGYQNFVFFG